MRNSGSGLIYSLTVGSLECELYKYLYSFKISALNITVELIFGSFIKFVIAAIKWCSLKVTSVSKIPHHSGPNFDSASLIFGISSVFNLKVFRLSLSFSVGEEKEEDDSVSSVPVSSVPVSSDSGFSAPLTFVSSSKSG
ncbi:unnamed protein product [[Candida] boidinii]|nr:unnamed protein product [[Candida] boidinii]